MIPQVSKQTTTPTHKTNRNDERQTRLSRPSVPPGEPPELVEHFCVYVTILGQYCQSHHFEEKKIYNELTIYL